MREALNISAWDRRAAKACIRRPRCAFTLVEMIVVIVILAILAAVIAPRLSGQSERRAEVEAIAIQRLLSAAAERATLLGGQNLAVEYGKVDDVTRLAMMERPGSSDPESTRRVSSEWVEDRLVEPVVLENLELRYASADGRRLDVTRWLVPLGGVQVRPSLSLVLAPRDTGAKFGFRIELTPEATLAARHAIPAADATVGSGRGGTGQAERAVDLDATGRGDVPW